jgi:hypothetical protein
MIKMLRSLTVGRVVLVLAVAGVFSGVFDMGSSSNAQSSSSSSHIGFVNSGEEFSICLRSDGQLEFRANDDSCGGDRTIAIDDDTNRITIFGDSVLRKGNTAVFGDASGWDPNPSQSNGLFLESGIGESAGIYFDDDTIAMWSAGDRDLLRLYDEDSLPGGRPRFRVTDDGDIIKTGTVSFVEAHPTDISKEIVYASLEGPEAGTYIRGTAQLVNGEAVIELPEHFGFVTAEEGLTVQLTPLGEWLQLYVVEKSTLRLVVREAQGKSGRFDYLVQGIRKGYENYQVIRNKEVP